MSWIILVASKRRYAMHKFGSYLDTQGVLNGLAPLLIYRDDRRVAWKIVEIPSDYSLNTL